jgi:hypothetical protein
LKGVGFSVEEADIASVREQFRTVEHADPFPSEWQLLKALNLQAVYERVYREASGFVHFSFATAIDELDRPEVHYERDEWPLADEALLVAVGIYEIFLQASDQRLGHGLGPRVHALIDNSPLFREEAR